MVDYLNNGMELSFIEKAYTKQENITVLFRHNDNTFIIVKDFYLTDDSKEIPSCEWNYAIQYDIETREDAHKIFVNKIDTLL